MHDLDRNVMEYGDYEGYDMEDALFAGESEMDMYESPFSEEEEIDLATELLSVSDDRELDYFFGKLVNKVGQFAKSSAGRALGGMLKNVASKALPIAGRALGTWVGGPVGGALGGKLASAAGRYFGLELEGMSEEDQSFEIARRMVRLAGSAAQKASMMPMSGSPVKIARKALMSAAKHHAPGLFRGLPHQHKSSSGRSGRWIRTGNKIVLLGA